jgi:hypothetical protein
MFSNTSRYEQNHSIDQDARRDVQVRCKATVYI